MAAEINAPQGTSIYVHSIEADVDYSGEIPSSFYVIDLPPCKYPIFRGEPYDNEKYSETMGACKKRGILPL